MGRIFMTKKERIAQEQEVANKASVSALEENGATAEASAGQGAEEERVRLTCDISKQHHLTLKYAAMMSGTTIVETVESLIEDNLQSPETGGR
jgi:hypothetical protein